MTAKNASQLQAARVEVLRRRNTLRATTQLRADHQPRRLTGFTEPRLSPADERAVVETAHRRNGQTIRSELQKSIAAMTVELEFIEANLGKVSPGDHRDTVRFARRAMTRLARTVNT